MMDFLAVYSEAGMIGVVGAMFVYMVYSMNKRATEQAQALENLKIENKGQSETLENMEGMVIKLLTGGTNQMISWIESLMQSLKKLMTLITKFLK